MTNTFTVQHLFDYSFLHEQFEWEPPTEIEAYDQDVTTGEYIHQHYWVTPWTDEDEKSYEIQCLVAQYNSDNGTNIDPEDVKSYSFVDGVTYQFTV